MMTTNSSNERPPLIAWLLAPVVLPISVLTILIVVALFGVYLAILFPFSEIWQYQRARKLRRAGRAIGWSDIEREIQIRPGSFILDSTAIGCNHADVWWTDESVVERAHRCGLDLPNPSRAPEVFEARMANPVFDDWCNAYFLNESSGIAKFVQSTRTLRGVRRIQSRIESLRALAPQCEAIETFSWMITMKHRAVGRT